MKKIGQIFKEASENRIKGYLKESNAVIVIKYSGLSSPAMTLLRRNLKNSQASFFVVKNSVACRALKNAGLEPLVKSIQGPCGMVFVKDEPVAVSKVLCDYSKDHEQMKLEGGLLKDAILEPKDIENMAKLPTKEALRHQVVMTLNAPISGLVIALNQILAKLVYCLDAIKQKKSN
jgi:large subunit ribosomal protein L10